MVGKKIKRKKKTKNKKVKRRKANNKKRKRRKRKVERKEWTIKKKKKILEFYAFHFFYLSFSLSNYYLFHFTFFSPIKEKKRWIIPEKETESKEQGIEKKKKKFWSLLPSIFSLKIFLLFLYYLIFCFFSFFFPQRKKLIRKKESKLRNISKKKRKILINGQNKA